MSEFDLVIFNLARDPWSLNVSLDQVYPTNGQLVFQLLLILLVAIWLLLEVEDV